MGGPGHERGRGPRRNGDRLAGRAICADQVNRKDPEDTGDLDVVQCLCGSRETTSASAMFPRPVISA